MPTTTRTLRTPAERAIAALGVEQRRVDKLEGKRDFRGVATTRRETETEGA